AQILQCLGELSQISIRLIRLVARNLRTTLTAFAVAVCEEVLLQQQGFVFGQVLGVSDIQAFDQVFVSGQVFGCVELNAFHGGKAFAHAVQHKVQEQLVSGNVREVCAGVGVELNVEPGSRLAISDIAVQRFSRTVQEVVLLGNLFVTADGCCHVGVLLQVVLGVEKRISHNKYVLCVAGYTHRWMLAAGSAKRTSAQAFSNTTGV